MGRVAKVDKLQRIGREPPEVKLPGRTQPGVLLPLAGQVPVVVGAQRAVAALVAGGHLHPGPRHLAQGVAADADAPAGVLRVRGRQHHLPAGAAEVGSGRLHRQVVVVPGVDGSGFLRQYVPVVVVAPVQHEAPQPLQGEEVEVPVVLVAEDDAEPRLGAVRDVVVLNTLGSGDAETGGDAQVGPEGIGGEEVANVHDLPFQHVRPRRGVKGDLQLGLLVPVTPRGHVVVPAGEPPVLALPVGGARVEVVARWRRSGIQGQNRLACHGRTPAGLR